MGATSTSIVIPTTPHPVYAPPGSGGSTAVTIDGGILWASTTNIGRVTVDGGSLSIAAAGATPVYITTPAISTISTRAGSLWNVVAYATSTGTILDGLGGIVRLYNALATDVVLGDNVVASWPVATVSTATLTVGSPTVGAQQDWGPRGMAFSVACAVDVGVGATSTGNVANAKITALFT